MNEIIVEKNEDEEGSIPHIWRPIFKKIVKAFVEKDYKLSSSIENVSSISENTAKQIKEYIEDYGEELIELPETTWKTSVYIYYGEYWNVLIDLFTKEGNRSDLVLNVEVREIDKEYIFKVRLVYIP